MGQLSTSPKMSRTESGLSRMSGSRTNEGLKGSDVGTRSQDEDGNPFVATMSSQELPRRRFFDHTNRSKRPALRRRNTAQRVSRTTTTTVTETVVDLAGDDRTGTFDRRFPYRDGQAAAPSSNPVQLTVPAVPQFPTFSNPSVPTVPAYPFNTPSSQSVLSSPPPSPAPSDTSFTLAAITVPIASPTASPGSESPSPTKNPSRILDTVTPTIAVPTIIVSYSNTSLATSTRSHPTGSAGFISSSQRTTFSTRISSFSPQSPSENSISGAAATTSATGTAPVSVATPGSNSDSSTSSSGPAAPNTPQVVGGVVGGIAGFAVILLVLLYFLRRYRKQLQDRGELLEPEDSGRDVTDPTSMRSSHTPLVAAITASFNKMRPASSRTTATGDTGTSDRGFQRVAGRKIDPVLTSGGDGYGGNYGAFEKETGLNKETGGPSSPLPEAQPLAGTSYYREDSDFYGAHDSRTSTPTGAQLRVATDNHDFADHNQTPSPDAIAVMRPSPARSPVTTSAGPNYLAPPERTGPTMASDAPPTPTLPPRFVIPDGVGRSLVSQDGSRGSRFTESV
jgi:hypothetical protein